MHFLMGDPRKVASMILEGRMKKAPEANGGGEKKVEHGDRGTKLLEAIHGRDAESLIGAIEAIVQAAVQSKTDENPKPPTLGMGDGDII